MDRINLLFSAIVYASAGLAGSAASGLVIGAAGWAIIRASIGSFPLAKDQAIRIAGLALSSLFIADALSLTANGSLSYLGSSGSYALLFLTPLLFYSRLGLTRPTDLARATVIGALTGAAVAAAMSIWFWYFRNAMRIEGLSGNASVFGLVAAVLYALLVPAVISAANWRMRGPALFGAACAAFATVASGTRSLLPFVALFPVLSAWLMREDLRFLGRFKFWTGLAAFAAVIGLAALPFLGWRLDLLWRMFFEPGSFEPGLITPLSSRQAIWSTAWNGFVENPWFGVGGADMRQYLFDGTAKLLGEGMGVSHAHNVFLNYMLRDGVFGLAAILAILSLPFVLRRHFHEDREGRWAYAAFCGLFTCYFCSGMFGIMFGHDVFDALFVYTVALLLFTGCRQRTLVTGPALNAMAAG